MDLARLKARRDDLETGLREASMSAARAWKKGNSKNMGIQVAMYHAEEVRSFVVAVDYGRCTVLIVKCPL